jgi:hypothetical protein
MKIYNLWLFRFVLLQVSCSNIGAQIILIEGSFLSPFKRIIGAIYSTDTFNLTYLFGIIFVSWYIYWLFET